MQHEPFRASLHDGGPPVIHVNGELDLATAPTLRALCDEAFDRHRGPLRLDLSGVTFIDSTGIRLLVEINERATGQRRALWIIAPQPPAWRAIHLSGLTDLLPFVETPTRRATGNCG